MEGAKSFYRDKLGLKEVATNVEGGDDVLVAVNELKAKGVQFESYDMPGLKTDENNIATFGEYKAFWFKDPEGHILAIGNM